VVVVLSEVAAMNCVVITLTIDVVVLAAVNEAWRDNRELAVD
jgi:hypothetical protein